MQPVENIKSKYIVLTSGRTGSNLLRSLLNSHPEMVCDAELFLGNERFEATQDPFLHVEKNKLLNDTKTAYGYMLSLYQINQMKTVGGASRFLLQMQKDGWKIIYLYRSNIPMQALSFLKARKTKIYHLLIIHELPKGKINLSLSEVFKTIYALKYYRRREERLLQNIPHISIDYMRDLADTAMHQNTVNTICRYLNIDFAAISTDSIRVSNSQVNEDFMHGDRLLSAAKLFSFLVTPLVIMSEAMHYYLDGNKPKTAADSNRAANVL